MEKLFDTSKSIHDKIIKNMTKRLNREDFKFTFLCHTKEVAYENEILARGDAIVRIPTRRQNFFKFYSFIF